MGHGIVHDQGVRRREMVILSLRFLQDYVFDFYVTSFLARRRCNFMNFEPNSHGTVYYESINRKLNRRLICECRCDERLKATVNGTKN